jgi:hypothetical protein
MIAFEASLLVSARQSRTLLTYTVEGIINENIEAGSMISTDEHRAYHGLRHAYTLESHWSLFKRAVKGKHVQIFSSGKYRGPSKFAGVTAKSTVESVG